MVRLFLATSAGDAANTFVEVVPSSFSMYMESANDSIFRLKICECTALPAVTANTLLFSGKEIGTT